VGSTLARELTAEGNTVAVIDRRADAFLRLGDGFSGQTVVCIGFDPDILVAAGIERAAALAAVTSGDNSNNMIATTIHKSKGLEFDVVLVPYLSGEVQKYNDLLWAEPNPPHPDFPPLVPVPFSGKLKNSMFRDKWEEETLNQWLDALNLLYVTFTRPRRMLEVWSPLKKDNLLVAAADRNYSRIESMLLFALMLLNILSKMV
jgi:superfamily I DNA/RNA helicase